ncbi:MAG: (d)CMP kinase [Candidatus Saccharimonadales bacterium]
MENIITIDGPSGAGKTTVALHVARQLELAYIPSGRLFRAAAYVMQQNQIRSTNEDAVTAFANALDLGMHGDGRIVYQDQDITEYLDAPEVGVLSTKVAQNQGLRLRLLAIQREIGLRKGCVIEGRSTGIEVFPEAALKIWLTADVETRRKRKTHSEGIAAAGAIMSRDQIDAARNLAPMHKAPDAIEINTTNMSVEDVTTGIVQHYYDAQGQ